MDNKFYRLKSEHKKGVFKIQSVVEYNTLSFIEEKSNLKKHNHFIVKAGTKLYDIIPFNDSSNFAISLKIKELLEKNNITGWNCFKIKIEGINTDYFAFQNLSKAGKILNLEAINNYETENIEFDIRTWNGSDVFYLEDTAINVITPRVKEILEKAKVTNVEILPL